jgi:hypothetical protein
MRGGESEGRGSPRGRGNKGRGESEGEGSPRGGGSLNSLSEAYQKPIRRKMTRKAKGGNQ